MNRHAAIDVMWAGGEHTFRLGLDQIEELEAAIDMSLFLLHAAVASDLPFARMKHYSETIRLGLIGGGMPPLEARLLTRKYVDERPLDESVKLAKVVLAAAMARLHTKEVEDAVGEREAAELNGSTSPPSTGMQS